MALALCSRTLRAVPATWMHKRTWCLPQALSKSFDDELEPTHQSRHTVLHIPSRQLSPAALAKLLHEDDDQTEWLEQVSNLIEQQEFGRINWEDVVEHMRWHAADARSKGEEHAAKAMFWLLLLQLWPNDLTEEQAVQWRLYAKVERWELVDSCKHVRRYIAATLGTHYRAAVRMFYEYIRKCDWRDNIDIPTECPYTMDQLLELNWHPDGHHE